MSDSVTRRLNRTKNNGWSPAPLYSGAGSGRKSFLGACHLFSAPIIVCATGRCRPDGGRALVTDRQALLPSVVDAGSGGRGAAADSASTASQGGTGKCKNHQAGCETGTPKHHRGLQVF